MTPEKLRQYTFLISDIKALDEQIKSLYIPISSPNGDTSEGSHGNVPGDPTAAAVKKIMKAKERMADRLEQQSKLLEEIEEWIEEIDDIEIETIVRVHFILGETWRETNRRVYGYDSPFRVRKKFYRYFEKK